MNIGSDHNLSPEPCGGESQNVYVQCVWLSSYYTVGDMVTWTPLSH